MQLDVGHYIDSTVYMDRYCTWVLIISSSWFSLVLYDTIGGVGAGSP